MMAAGGLGRAESLLLGISVVHTVLAAMAALAPPPGG